MKLHLDRLQPLGRALMLPIAVLPIAALLLRLGQADMLDLPFVAAAGSASGSVNRMDDGTAASTSAARSA